MEVVEYTVSLCTVIAGVQLLNKARSIDAEGIRERSYRLQHMDPDKARVDVAFIVGGTAVSLLFAANAFQEWVGSTVVERMVRGFAFGGALGFISTAGGVERIWKVGFCCCCCAGAGLTCDAAPVVSQQGARARALYCCGTNAPRAAQTLVME